MARQEQPEQDAAPTREELERCLRRLMTKGLPAARREDVEPLLSLNAIRVVALVDLDSARMAALRDRLQELTKGTRNETLRHLAPYAFGFFSVKNLSLEERLKYAERQMSRSWESLRRKPLDDLARDFADRLLWLEARLRYNHWLERPFDETLHDEVLRQYDFYTAMAFWLNAAALELGAALEYHRDGESVVSRDFNYSALWRWTKFLRFAQRYDDAFFGEGMTSPKVGLDIGQATQATVRLASYSAVYAP